MHFNIYKLLVLLSFFYTSIAYAGVTDINIPETPMVVRDPASTSFVSKKIDAIIEEEVSGQPQSPSEGWTTVDGFTLKEGEKYFKQAVIERLKNNPKKDELLQEVFSPKHFMTPTPSLPQDQLDVLNPDEQKLEHLYLMYQDLIDTCLRQSLCGSNKLEKEKDKIDPRLLMLPGEKIRDLFFKHLQGNWTLESFKEVYLIENQKPERTFEQHVEDLFGPENFGIPQDPDQRLSHFLSHQISFLDQEMIANNMIVANRILAMTSPGDNIIIFGNTPYFVGRALQLIGASDESKKRNVIEFPFSGAPNQLRDILSFSPHDGVTPDRLAHLQQRLRQHGLMSDNPELSKKKTFFVDVIGSGGGIAYTLETILCDFKQNKREPFPDFEVISLNEFSFTTNPKNASVASTEGKDGEKVQLTFPSKAAPHFSVDCHVVYLPGHGVLDRIPDQFPDVRIFPKYNAAFWNSEYDYLLTQEPQSHIKIMLDHFDENIKNMAHQPYLLEIYNELAKLKQKQHQAKALAIGLN